MKKDEFIRRSTEKHGNIYDYSLVPEQFLTNDKIDIICSKHGIFNQIARLHCNRGNACGKCSHNILTKDEYINKVNNIHRNQYEYNIDTQYVCHKHIIIIICPLHGEFKQRAGHHIEGHSCKQCCHESYSFTLEQFITKCTTKHNNKYDYTLVKYVNNRRKVAIICPVHGLFKQVAGTHLTGGGCKQCSYVPRLSQDNFLKYAKEIHGAKYDYNKSVCISSNHKLEIICPIHGSFWQTPNAHIYNECGCRKCNLTGGLREKYFERNPLMKKHPAKLYLIELSNADEHFYKIGITTSSIKGRFKGRGLKSITNILYQANGELYSLYKIEKELLILLTDYKYVPLNFRGGHTECFRADDSTLKHLLSVITNLHQRLQ